ncbi:unnamed protein product [Closterium sp. Naga37s-1]|nr:unnamed protein product [Closterium sp. Naga37s-1]
MLPAAPITITPSFPVIPFPPSLAHSPPPFPARHLQFGPLEGAFFADYGTDLGSGATVLGDPAGARGKPGRGFGLGAGVRVDSPLGPLRLEYAFNDQKIPRFHFGIGYRN